MANFLVVMRKLSNAGESIKKVNLAFIKNYFLDKESPPKYLNNDTLAMIKEIQEELNEIELVLITQKKKK